MIAHDWFWHLLFWDRYYCCWQISLSLFLRSFLYLNILLMFLKTYSSVPSNFCVTFYVACFLTWMIMAAPNHNYSSHHWLFLLLTIIECSILSGNSPFFLLSMATIIKSSSRFLSVSSSYLKFLKLRTLIINPDNTANPLRIALSSK